MYWLPFPDFFGTSSSYTEEEAPPILSAAYGLALLHLDFKCAFAYPQCLVDTTFPGIQFTIHQLVELDGYHTQTHGK